MKGAAQDIINESQEYKQNVWPQASIYLDKEHHLLNGSYSSLAQAPAGRTKNYTLFCLKQDINEYYSILPDFMLNKQTAELTLYYKSNAYS